MNVPFLCILLAFLLVYAPRLVTAKGQAERPEGYDNSNPRDQQAKLEGIAKRALAAHLNGFESFPAFAASVICAHLAQADGRLVIGLALAHVVFRAIYVALYLADRSVLRSVVWTLGFLCVLGLFTVSLV